MVLPGDEIASVRDYDGMTFGDVDGDGVVDVAIDYYTGTQLLLGPLSGALDKQAGVSVAGWLRDVDLDGILDLTYPDHTYLLETRIKFGPMSRWESDPMAQKPDLTLDWACDDAANPTTSPQELNPVPDLDGDGHVDIWTGSNNSWPFGWCWGYVFSLPASGEVAMIGQARGGFVGVGDQNGDGFGDFVTHDPLGIGLGPVTFGSTAPIGSEPSYVVTSGQQFDIDPALQELSATVVDWTGDGVRDLLASVELYGADGSLTDIVLVPVEGGAAGLAKRSYPRGWHSTSTGPVFVEDGTAYVLSPARDNRIVPIPIGGPAAVIAQGPTVTFGL
ncbi:MAG: hypothetical protein ABMA64_35625 [Myxococcota bacterium]